MPYLLVDSEAVWEQFTSALEADPHGIVGFDTETTGVSWTDTLVGVSVATEPGIAFYFPLAHQPEESLFYSGEAVNLAPELREQLFQLLAGVPSVAHNAAFDFEKCRQAGYVVNIQHDTLVQCYLHDCTQPKGLKDAAKRYLGMEMREFTSLFPKGRGERRFDKLNPLGEEREALVNYACQDADVCLQLHLLLWGKVQADCADLYRIENRIWRVACDMQARGLMLEKDRLEASAPVLQAKIPLLEAAFHEAVREQAHKIGKSVSEIPININSTPQVADLLFTQLEIPSLGNGSTEERHLTPLVDEFPAVKALIEYRDSYKLLNSFVKALPELVCADGAIRAHFKPFHTRTGRFSQEDPNLQQIPKYDATGIRKAFVPRPGFYLLDADYSQIEVRVFVALAGDQATLAAIEGGADFHTLTAQKVFHIADPKDVTGEQRRKAKNVNFGILYGISEFGLSKQWAIEPGEAKKEIQRYFRGMPAVKRFIDETHRQAQKDGYVRTHFGRKRPLPDVNSDDYGLKSSALRQAVNTLVQGGAADIMKMALVRLHERLPEIGAFLLLTVHDSALIEVPESVPFWQAEKLVRECMEIEVPGWCRLPVEATAGYRWGEEDVELMARGRPELAEGIEKPSGEDSEVLAVVDVAEPLEPVAVTRMRFPAVVWSVSRTDAALAGTLRKIRDACVPREGEGSYLYLETKVGDRRVTLESNQRIQPGKLMAHYLSRLKLRGLLCRVLDGEGQGIERQQY